MKHKRYIFIIILAVVAVMSAIIALSFYLVSNYFSTSQQMKNLRQLEASLNLPKPTERFESDEGSTRDMFGAAHYKRNIMYSYYNFESDSLLKNLRAELTKRGWQQVPLAEDGKNTYLSFTNGEGDSKQCITAGKGIDLYSDQDRKVLYLNFAAAGDDLCN